MNCSIRPSSIIVYDYIFVMIKIVFEYTYSSKFLVRGNLFGEICSSAIHVCVEDLDIFQR